MKCLKCNDTGFVLIPNPLMGFNENGDPKGHLSTMCECRLAKEDTIVMDRKLVDARIPKNYKDLTINSYLGLEFPANIVEANKPTINKIKLFLESPSEFLNNYNVLWLWGSTCNSGKTSLAVILGKEFIKKGIKVRFITIQDLLNAFTDFNSKEEYFKELEMYQVYIIDDALNTERGYAQKDYTRINFFTWINSCFNSDKKFICTSNVPLIQVADIYSQIKSVLLRSSLTLELKGDLTTLLSKGII